MYLSSPRVLCAIPRRAVRNGVISRFTVFGYVTHRLYSMYLGITSWYRMYLSSPTWYRVYRALRNGGTVCT